LESKLPELAEETPEGLTAGIPAIDVPQPIAHQ
jgi:hypothetical protein